MPKIPEEPFYQQIVRDIRVRNAWEYVLDVLEARFGSAPGGVADKVQAIADLDRLKALHRSAVRASSIEEFLLALDEEWAIAGRQCRPRRCSR